MHADTHWIAGAAAALALAGAASSQAVGCNGMVATHHPLATSAGLRILQRIFLNNGMCYFSLDPNDPNHIQGGARPRFVMSPTIVFRFDKPYFATGAAGGWTIPQTVLRFLANSIPYVPGTDISIDAGISAEVRHQLEARGHRIIPPRDDVAGATPMPLNTILIDPKSGALWGGGGVATW